MDRRVFLGGLGLLPFMQLETRRLSDDELWAIIKTMAKKYPKGKWLPRGK